MNDYVQQKKSWQENWLLYVLTGVLIIILATGIMLIPQLINPSNVPITSDNKNNSVNNPIPGSLTKIPNVPFFEIKTDNFGQISLPLVYGVNNENINLTIQKIIELKHLRGLSDMESGKRIEYTSEGTSFFISHNFLGGPIMVSSYIEHFFNFPSVENKPQYPNGYFSVLYISNNEAYILGFVSTDISSTINKLDWNSEETFPLFPEPSDERNVLVIIPVNRIIQAESRDISLDNRQIYLLDITIK